MTSISTPANSKSKRPRRDQRAAEVAKPTPKQPKINVAARKPKRAAEKENGSTIPKQAKILKLLNQPQGASIEDLIEATSWQQHSVRGFLAGTIKKKLGLVLTSTKSEGSPRRYRIVTRRGR